MLQAPPKVFISYSHDSEAHGGRVLALADQLERNGLETIFDQYEPTPAIGWNLWMRHGLREADFVLMICTEIYYQRVEHQARLGEGLGVKWEGSLIQNALYNDSTPKQKYIPILLEETQDSFVPDSVRDHNRYRLAGFDLSDPGYENLYRHLTDQSKVTRPKRGPMVSLSRGGQVKLEDKTAFDPAIVSTRSESVRPSRPPRGAIVKLREDRSQKICRYLLLVAWLVALVLIVYVIVWRSLINPFNTEDLLQLPFNPKGEVSRPDWAPTWAVAWGQDEYGSWAAFEVDGVRQRLRWIPPGRFKMGSPEYEKFPEKGEGPQHEEMIASGFWLFETECSQSLWEAVMGKESNQSKFKGAALPVENVSWDDVQEFVAKINGRVAGLELALPSEKHWEYACRAGTKGPRYESSLDEIAWYVKNSDGKTHPVGLKQPNAWGLYDMFGNVWEWCSDPWRDSYSDPVPSDTASAPRVLRGGSWVYVARYVRAACRGLRHPSLRLDYQGFRCVEFLSRGPVPAEPE